MTKENQNRDIVESECNYIKREKKSKPIYQKNDAQKNNRAINLRAKNANQPEVGKGSRNA